MILGSAAVLVGIIITLKIVLGGEDATPSNATAAPSATPVTDQDNASTPVSRKTAVPPRGGSSAPAQGSTPPPGNQSTANLSAIVPPTEKPVEKVSMGSGMAGATQSTGTQKLPDSPRQPSPAPTQTQNQSQAQTQTTSTTSPPTIIAPPASADLPKPTSSSSAAAPNTSSNSTAANTPANQRVQAGLTLLAQNKPLDARRMLTAALLSPGMSSTDAERARQELTTLNQRIVFGPEVVPGDPYATHYNIESGDSLAKLPRKLGLKVDWRLLQRINRLSAPERIQVGQRIKVLKGPFHAVIHKREFRLDLFMGEGDNRVYVQSFKVGLGEHGATPEGAFVVKQNSKLINPAWTNPRTGESFTSDDPKNPLGEYWIGLIGASDNIRGLETYGIHGTVEPESIGQLRSMGCVRMLHDDVALIYELLIENASTVEIHGDDYP